MFFTFLNFTEEILVLNYNWKSFFFLVPNCLFYYIGAKLSWCQIVRFYYVGVKLSGAKLSWCQIVQVLNCLMPNCPVPNCPTTFFLHRLFCNRYTRNLDLLTTKHVLLASFSILDCLKIVSLFLNKFFNTKDI